MKLIKFNVSSIDNSAGKQGKLKEVNGVNGTPRSIAPGFPDLEDQFNQIGIKYLRFHDNLGFGDLDNYFVDNDQNSQFTPNIPTYKQSAALKLISSIGNVRTIFPNAAAGMRSNNVDLAFKEANYAMTDQHFKEVLDNNLNPGIQRDILFRIGRTNRGGSQLPENFDIYATLVSTLVNRYSLNYQTIGLPRKITYWEIWNEPDLTMFWNSNNPQDYYEFYSKIARMIKAVDPSSKVGGSGVANGYNPGGEYIDGLLKYCRENDVPIDFLSWHYYGNNTSDPQNIITCGNQVQKSLNQYNYNNLESLCTEWNSTPFASANVFSKVQSAKNAAYIASTLIYMQYTKVDLAYYYRGDASSFGMFNNSGHFCSYSSQAFHLFSKLLETPTIISGDMDFSSGLSVISCKNDTGDRINILAANYVIDPDFSTTNPPKESPLYPQHYVDGNRQLEQLADSWSIKEWFGGVDPTTITPDNYVPVKSQEQQLPVHGSLRAIQRDYNDSKKGLTINLENINYKSCKLFAYRIKEGGNLDKVLAPDVSNEISFSLENNTLNINDPGAVNSTVTLYSLEMDNNAPTPVPDRRLTSIHEHRNGKLVSISWEPDSDFYVNKGEILKFKYSVSRFKVKFSRLDNPNLRLIRAKNSSNNTVEGEILFKEGGYVRPAIRGKFGFRVTGIWGVPMNYTSSLELYV